MTIGNKAERFVNGDFRFCHPSFVTKCRNIIKNSCTFGKHLHSPKILSAKTGGLSDKTSRNRFYVYVPDKSAKTSKTAQIGFGFGTIWHLAGAKTKTHDERFFPFPIS